MKRSMSVIAGLSGVLLPILACGPTPTEPAEVEPRVVTVEMTWTPSNTEVAEAVVTDTPAPTRATARPPVEDDPEECTTPANWEPYVVRSGDTLFRIAQNHGLSLAQLRDGNCMTGMSLRAGETIYVPPGGNSGGSGGGEATEEATDDPGPELEAINFSDQLEFGGGGGDGWPFICPDKASGAKPSVVFGRDIAPYTYGKLCLYDVALVPGNEHVLTLTSPLGAVYEYAFLLEGDPEEGDIPLDNMIISDTRLGTSQIEISLFLPPSQPVGTWTIKIDNGSTQPESVPFDVLPFEREVLYVVPQGSTPFVMGPCCSSGDVVRYEGADFMPDHRYGLGGYLLDIPYDIGIGDLLFQSEVMTNSAGIFLLDEVLPDVSESRGYCLALLDPDTDTVVVEDFRFGSFCRFLDP